MYDTILFDLDGTLAPFLQDEFIHTYFKLLVRRVTPMGYDGEKLVHALWSGVNAMIRNDGSATNRQLFWNIFTGEMGIQALALESVLNDFYAREFDGARQVLREDADRSGLIRSLREKGYGLVLALIRSLREKGYGLVLATNPVFPAVAVETRMHWVGLAATDFDYITTYENSRRSKPNPDYFRDILSHIGKEGGECLMVGNNPVDDMAAQEAGLDVFLVTDYLENPGNLPVDRWPHGSFGELEKLLAELPGR